MSAMKRLLEDYTHGILAFLFPDGLDGMSSEDKKRWWNHAEEGARKMLDSFGHSEVVMGSGSEEKDVK